MTQSLPHSVVTIPARPPKRSGTRLRYIGPLITDTSVSGERKADGVIPAHPGGGALQLSCDRWIIFYATLDPRGWDSNRSILYQLRRDSPDGEVIREGAVARCREDWDPLNQGHKLFKSCGMPIAFGVPRGAIFADRPIPSANVFVVKWYHWPHRLHEGRLLHPSHHREQWPQGPTIKHRTLRVEWMQFRLNDTSDDIQTLMPPAMLRQCGYETGDAFCSLGPGLQMNHSMKPPVAIDASCSQWVEYDGFTPYQPESYDHGAIAPVRYAFNKQTRLYEWVETGPLTEVPGRVIGETSTNRVDSTWIVAARRFEYANDLASTCWYRTDNPMAGLGQPRLTEAGAFPRTVFVCGDGVLRLFTNDKAANRSPQERAALCCWDVDPIDFTLSNRRVVFNAHAKGLPFDEPFVDMAKLCPARGRRQVLLFRVIDRWQTCNVAERPRQCRAALEQAGIHASEFIYDHPAPDAWSFGKAH